MAIKLWKRTTKKLTVTVSALIIVVYIISNISTVMQSLEIINGGLEQEISILVNNNDLKKDSVRNEVVKNVFEEIHISSTIKPNKDFVRKNYRKLRAKTEIILNMEFTTEKLRFEKINTIETEQSLNQVHNLKIQKEKTLLIHNEIINDLSTLTSSESKNVNKDNLGPPNENEDGNQLLQSTVTKDSFPIILEWSYGRDLTNSYRAKMSKELQCLSGKCISTYNQSEYWNPKTKIILFEGSFFKVDKLPLPRISDHLWALSHENSPYTAWILSLDNMISLFNYTATFRRESDFPSTLQYYPAEKEWFDTQFVVPTEEKNRLQKEEGLAPVVYIQSNCQYVPSDRDHYVKEFMKHIQVDSYGKCLNNRDMPENLKGRDKHSDIDMYKLVSKYKFQLAFENSLCPDYMTEKIFRPLKIGVVPIYHGSSRIKDFIPTEKAVIKVSDYKNPEELANFIKFLNNNDEEYKSYLKHKQMNITLRLTTLQTVADINKKIKLPKHMSRFMISSFQCFLCDKLYERMNSKSSIIPSKIANSSHMGCPMPKSFNPGGFLVNINENQWRREADAYMQMMQKHEKNIDKFPLYLKESSLKKFIYN